MQKSLVKFAPQMMVLAVALYWSWPALKASLPQVSASAYKTEVKKPAGPEFAAAALSPKFLPFPSRNPFLALDHKPKKAGAATATRMAKSGKKPDGAAKPTSILDAGFVLNATCIMGKQRLAVINDHVYKEKDVLPQAGDQTPNCFVTAILPHKVLLSCQGETVQLGYVNIASKPAAPTNPEKPAK
jgi:hypothetical protein